jgi:hypothetical protein
LEGDYKKKTGNLYPIFLWLNMVIDEPSRRSAVSQKISFCIFHVSLFIFLSYMPDLHVEIEINASPERVWEVLTDFSSYPQWNPFIREISGKPEDGARLRAVMHPPDARPSTFRPKVISARSPNYQPPFQFRWRGSLFIPGIFDGEHYFILEPLGPNKTKFIHGEKFTGLLVSYLWERLLHTKVRRGFGEMNLALKERAEKGATRA